MLKRIMSLTLTMCMLLSIFVITPVSAGAPVVLDGTTQVVFDQDFSGLSDASELEDFTVSGSSWVYAPDHMIINGSGAGSILTKSNVNVSDAKSWEFTSSQIMVYNNVYWYLGFDGTNGYILRYSQTNKTLSLYKDTTVSNISSATPVASVAAGNYYESPYVITVSYDDGTFTVYVQTNSAQKKAMLTYKEPTKTAINGKWGIYNGTKNLGVFHMTLKKTYDSIAVDQWRYDKTFSAVNTQAELEADGFTFSKTTTPGASGLYYKDKTFTFGPNGKDISGDYYFETKVTRSYNTYYLDFNHSSSGYYRIWYGVSDSSEAKNKPWIKLQKYDAEAADTYTLVEVAKTGISSGLTRTYKGTVKTLEDGSIDINIDIYNGDTLDTTLSYVDTDTDTVVETKTVETVTTQNVVDENGDVVYEEDGVTPKTEEVITTTTTTENADTGASLTSGKLRLISNSSGSNSYMKYLKVYSLMKEDEQEEKVKYTETIIDKTFTSADTKTSIAADGFSFERTNYTPTSTDDKGFDISASNQYFLYNKSDLGDEYSFTTNTYRTVNYTTIYFNYTDADNYYKLYYGAASSSTIYFKLYKNMNGAGETEIAKGSLNWNNHGRNAWSTNTITLSKNDDGSMNITAIQQQSGKSAVTITATDTSPLPTGTIRIRPSNGGRIKSFAISHTYYESSTNGEEPVFLGRFYNDTAAVKEIEKGNIYFDYPTAMLGKYTVVATLYEDYKMTGIKVIEPIDLYTGRVKLFDTTGSTAENMKVRVYFLDANNDLKVVADEVYELN